MTLEYLEHFFGVKLSAVVAGITGAIVSLSFHDKLTFAKALLLIITGGAVSGYSAYAAQIFLGLPVELGGFIGFVLGICSLKLADIVSKKFPE